ARTSRVLSPSTGVRALVDERRRDVREREADAHVAEPTLQRGALAQAVLILEEEAVGFERRLAAREDALDEPVVHDRERQARDDMIDAVDAEVVEQPAQVAGAGVKHGESRVTDASALTHEDLVHLDRDQPRVRSQAAQQLARDAAGADAELHDRARAGEVDRPQQPRDEVRRAADDRARGAEVLEVPDHAMVLSGAEDAAVTR